MDWKNRHSENEYTYPKQSIDSMQPNGIFQRTRTNNFTICMEIQKPQIAKANLKEKYGTGGNHLPHFQTILQSYNHQDSMVPLQRQKCKVGLTFKGQSL